MAKRKSSNLLLVPFLIVVFAAIMEFGQIPESGPSAKPDTSQKTDARTEKIESAFSPWDGSHRGLVSHVKRNMNDPSSFEHVETKYVDKGEYVLVIMEFRGANAFGGKVLNVVSAKCSVDGKSVEILTYN